LGNSFPFQVSVIIPVFNAEKFIEKAVLSALRQPEVAEVILINDFSPDGSWQVCEQLALLDPRIRLVHPPEGKNIGAGPARNLGIRAATRHYIAFLDADDYFAINRFAIDKKFFNTYPQIDGVYHAIGVCNYKIDPSGIIEQGKLTTLTHKVAPENLLLAMHGLLPPVTGHFSIIGLTLHKRVFSKVPGFPEHRLHQDSLFIWKLTATCQLMAGNLTQPMAYRGVHADNRISKNRPKATKSLVAAYADMMHWAHQENIPPLYLLFKTKYYLEKMICHRNKALSLGILLYLQFFTRSMINYDIVFDKGIKAAFGIRMGNLLFRLKKIILEKICRFDFSTEKLFKIYPPSDWIK
jgi:glycosyltransferase involved in cell wall biosynthesis